MDQLSPFRASTDSKSLLGFIDQRQNDSAEYQHRASRMSQHNVNGPEEGIRMGSSIGPDRPLNINLSQGRLSQEHLHDQRTSTLKRYQNINQARQPIGSLTKG